MIVLHLSTLSAVPGDNKSDVFVTPLLMLSAPSTLREGCWHRQPGHQPSDYNPVCQQVRVPVSPG